VKTGKLCLALAIVLAAHSGSVAATYYIDPAAGNDGGSGAKAAPWRTVAHALTSVSPGDTINLLPGDYGSVDFCPWGVSLGASWDAPITFQNDPDSPPHSAKFTDIKLNQSYDLYFRLIGFGFDEPNVSTCVYGRYASHVRIVDFVIHGNEGATTGPSLYAIWFRDAEDILVEDCEIHHTQAVGLEFGGCTNAVARGNHVHDVTGSALRSGGGSDLVFEYNRIEDQRPEWEPGVHGSGLSMHSSNTTVRGNIVRNFGNTRPIRWYQDVAGDYGYSNLLIENNLTYENYAWAPEFIDMGDNCVFRNNTFIGGATIKFARLVGGSGLHIYNNVVTGNLVVDNYGTSAELNAQTREVATAKWPNVHEGNNILQGLAASGGGYRLYCAQFQPGDGNLILKNDAGAYKPGYDASFFDVGSFFASDAGEYPYQLTAASAAVGFADPAHASAADLLQVARDAAPDAGAYEYSKPGDANGDGSVDLNDFVILKQTFGQNPLVDNRADFNGDGKVDLHDFVILKINFGS